jgi:hypothetical protein
MIRVETVSRKMRERFYYKVPQAGALIGLGRSQSYEAAERGIIPVEQSGRFQLVPRQLWDRRVKQLLKK